MDSPRSLEAAMARGIDPADLLPKSELDLLPAAGYKRHVAATLAARYEERRLELIEQVREERTAIIERLAGTRRSAAAAAETGAGARTSVVPRGANPDAVRSTALEVERRRNEFAKEKQRKGAARA